MKQPKVLFYDIEITANIGDVWGKYEQDVIHYRRQWYLLCFAYKWLGDKQTTVVALPDFELYDSDPENDREVVKRLHALFDEADVVVAHNGDQFDQKKAHARFIHHGLTPPSPYRQIDTKKVAKRYFNFNSNKLDDLGQYFGLGHKLETGGYGLWLGCEKGDPKAWKKMKRYNQQDVVLLEKIYRRMLPWIDNHPSMSLYGGNMSACRNCGKGPLHSKGLQVTTTATYQRWQCQQCGRYARSRIANKTDKPETV